MSRNSVHVVQGQKALTLILMWVGVGLISSFGKSLNAPGQFSDDRKACSAGLCLSLPGVALSALRWEGVLGLVL